MHYNNLQNQLHKAAESCNLCQYAGREFSFVDVWDVLLPSPNTVQLPRSHSTAWQCLYTPNAKELPEAVTARHHFSGVLPVFVYMEMVGEKDCKANTFWLALDGFGRLWLREVPIPFTQEALEKQCQKDTKESAAIAAIAQALHKEGLSFARFSTVYVVPEVPAQRNLLGNKDFPTLWEAVGCFPHCQSAKPAPFACGVLVQDSLQQDKEIALALDISGRLWWTPNGDALLLVA